MTPRTLCSCFASLITLILVLQPVPAQPAGSAPAVMSIPPATVAAGSETNVPIKIETGGTGLGALQFDLVYDPTLLEAVRVDPGRLLSGLTDFKVTSPGRVRVALATSEGVRGEGEILIAVFRGVGEGESRLTIENARAWEQATSFETTLRAEQGFVTVEAPGRFPTVAVVIGLTLAGALLLIVVIIAVIVLKRKQTARASSYAPVTGTPLCPPSPVILTTPPAASAGQIRCGCGQLLAQSSRFCPSCGTAFASASSRCPSCGGQTTPGARFCTACGQPVAG